MRKSAYELLSPQIEKCLSEKDIPQTAKEIAESLGVITSSVYNVLPLMEVFDVIQREKIGGRLRYFIKGVYDDKQLSAMFPIKKVKRIPRRKYAHHSMGQAKLPGRESLLEEHLSTMRVRASSGEGPSALAIIGLTRQETAEKNIPTEELLSEQDVDLEVEERKPETPIKSEPFSTVKHLPKDVRRLTLGQTKYLKEQLKGLDGYEGIVRFKTAFSKLSALKNGSYGTIFYFSAGTNPWEKVYKVTVDDSISLEMEKSVKMLRGKRRSKYDPIIDQFLMGGHDLVEIDVKGRKPIYVKSQLRRRIKDRKLEIATSSAGSFVYLERISSQARA